MSQLIHFDKQEIQWTSSKLFGKFLSTNSAMKINIQMIFYKFVYAVDYCGLQNIANGNKPVIKQRR